MSSAGLQKLITRGFFSEDHEGIYCGDTYTHVEDRKYFIQKDGHTLTAPYWSEPTTMSQQRYLREVLKDYPEAMILRVKYV